MMYHIYFALAAERKHRTDEAQQSASAFSGPNAQTGGVSVSLCCTKLNFISG